MPEFSVQITQPVAQINVASRQDCEVVEIDAVSYTHLTLPTIYSV